jgi:hypothetical protein
MVNVIPVTKYVLVAANRTRNGVIDAVKATTKPTSSLVIALFGTAALLQLGCTKPKAERTKEEKINSMGAQVATGSQRSGQKTFRGELR